MTLRIEFDPFRQAYLLMMGPFRIDQMSLEEYNREFHGVKDGYLKADGDIQSPDPALGEV